MKRIAIVGCVLVLMAAAFKAGDIVRAERIVVVNHEGKPAVVALTDIHGNGELIVYTRYPCRSNSLHEKTLHYACGGYIRHGRTVCTVGAVHKDQLEEAVVDAAVQFYQPYTIAEKGEVLIKKAIQQQLGSQQEQAAEQRVECEAESERIYGLVRNLLDHIKVSNRDIVNQRLDELSRERDGLESQLASLNQAVLEDDEIQELVQETIAFAASLDSTLHHGSLDQRRTALRRCVDGAVIDHPNKRAEMKLRVLPIGLDSHTTTITNTVVIEIAKKVSPNGRRRCESRDK